MVVNIYVTPLFPVKESLIVELYERSNKLVEFFLKIEAKKIQNSQSQQYIKNLKLV